MAVACTRCFGTQSSPVTFLLTCKGCAKAWHHRCHQPPVTDAELISRIKAHNSDPQSQNGLLAWKCRRCAKGKEVVAPRREQRVDVKTPMTPVIAVPQPRHPARSIGLQADVIRVPSSSPPTILDEHKSTSTPSTAVATQLRSVTLSEPRPSSTVTSSSAKLTPQIGSPPTLIDDDDIIMEVTPPVEVPPHPVGLPPEPVTSIAETVSHADMSPHELISSCFPASKFPAKSKPIASIARTEQDLLPDWIRAGVLHQRDAQAPDRDSTPKPTPHPSRRSRKFLAVCRPSSDDLWSFDAVVWRTSQMSVTE